MAQRVESEVAIQRAYYERTAAQYDRWHAETVAHERALDVMVAFLPRLKVSSVLDIGSGTGRVPLRLKATNPSLRIVAVEPAKGLREIAISKGLSQTR